jgi:hypothetical protein
VAIFVSFFFCESVRHTSHQRKEGMEHTLCGFSPPLLASLFCVGPCQLLHPLIRAKGLSFVVGWYVPLLSSHPISIPIPFLLLIFIFILGGEKESMHDRGCVPQKFPLPHTSTLSTLTLNSLHSTHSSLTTPHSHPSPIILSLSPKVPSSFIEGWKKKRAECKQKILT